MYTTPWKFYTWILRRACAPLPPSQKDFTKERKVSGDVNGSQLSVPRVLTTAEPLSELNGALLFYALCLVEFEDAQGEDHHEQHELDRLGRRQVGFLFGKLV